MDLLRLVEEYLRTPIVITGDAGAPTYVFEPPLTAEEQTTLAELRVMARFGVALTLAEWQGIKTDIALLQTFAGITNPTVAQTANATKAQSRILRVIIRS